MDAPTADLTICFDDAYRATTTTVHQWLRRMQAQRDEAGLPAVTRWQLVIEVKSPGRRPFRLRRLQRYAQLGVEEYWFIDPIERFVLFYVLDAGQYVMHTGIDNRYQSPRLPEVGIDLASFWKEVAERLPNG
jgi:Uma2 family endonuclease